jgi:hypothetical protein
MASSLNWNRRRFLRWTALGGVAAVLGWRFLIPARGGHFPDLVHLTESEGRVLAAVYTTVTGVENPSELTEAVRAMDRFLGELATLDRLELRAALQLVEHTPLPFHGLLSRFTSLSLSERVRCLEGWRSGPLWGRPVFSGLKELSYLVYYTRPAHWAQIGYTGPLVQVQVQPPATDAPVDPRYAALVAPL